MQSAMFSSLFGALTADFRLNTIANNLANVNTTGYKRDLQSFKDTMPIFAHDMIMEPNLSLESEKLLPDPRHMARTRIATISTDMSQGPLKGTGNKLDVAIAGDGFFTVNTPTGEYYTRNGHLRINQEGTLVTDQGYTILGDGGEITIPANTANITIAEDGRVFADATDVGQIGVVTIEDTSTIEKAGYDLYKVKPGNTVDEQPADFARTTIVQGFLEQPNVNVVTEMVNMIETQRQFEAYQKVMQTSAAIDQQATTKVGSSK